MKNNIGSRITIKENILNIHPKSPLAGRILEVVGLTEEQKKVNEHLAMFGERVDSVPVIYKDIVYYVEPEYIEENMN